MDSVQRKQPRRFHTSAENLQRTKDWTMEKTVKGAVLPRLIKISHNQCDICGKWYSTESFGGAWYCKEDFLLMILLAKQLEVGYSHD